MLAKCRFTWMAIGALSCSLLVSAQSSTPIKVAVIGLEHGHVSGFLDGLTKNPEVHLVGIVDPDAELSARYEAKYHLDHLLFFKDTDAMVAARHPQALLVLHQHLRPQEGHRISRQNPPPRDGREAAHHDSGGRALDPRDRPQSQHPRAGELRDDVVLQQQSRLRRHSARKAWRTPQSRHPRRPRRT